jgi:nifR3 family TIM-barrel protein
MTRTLPSTPTFYIQTIPVYGDLVLSPMAGFSDQPFRSLCRELGSAISYTEFINAIDVVQRSPKYAQKLAFLPAERPVVFQIFDNDPERLLEAALTLQELGPDVIDINMGCSVRRVSGRGAGAGLLKTPLKIARIMRRLSRALEVPVTAKIRLGWDDSCRNYSLVARIIEESGGALIAVHGRTRAQGYSGKADWDAIAQVKDVVSIPVIGNGDVRSVADIEGLKKHTRCDAVMIGRGAVGNPWIFSYRDRAEVPLDQVRETMLDHLGRMLSFYGDERGLVLFRKHLSRYLSPYPLTKEVRQSLLTAEQREDFISLLDAQFEDGR